MADAVRRGGPATTSMKRALLFVSVLTAIAALTLWLRADPERPVVAASIGLASEGHTAVELLGRHDQDGAAFTVYGYLTHVADLPDAALFSDPLKHNEATARFTFFGHATIEAHHPTDNVIGTAAAGTLT